MESNKLIRILSELDLINSQLKEHLLNSKENEPSLIEKKETFINSLNYNRDYSHLRETLTNIIEHQKKYHE